MSHSILGRPASDRQTVCRPSHQRRAIAASVLAGVVGTTGLVAAAPADAVVAGTTFDALEIFASEGPPTTAAGCGTAQAIPGLAKPADLPAGATASIVVMGAYSGPATPGAGGCSVIKVGTVEIAVPAGTKVQKGPLPQGGQVKVVAAADVTLNGETKLVAEKVVNRKRAGRPTELELAYIADVTATAKTAAQWTVKDKAGVELKFNVTGADIDAGLGNAVTIQFG